ncbi:M20 family metallopeptidase [Flavobacteriaceae bacterium TP-CH-4]|uniref:M20 family metallopeptidase n=1 Tax=Pelagihabitans pacificus TaxID=2696054 RepID=A0A967ASR1_9FLAO|nr:M20 family metallopeptidase [Pelagihabitans pacificus]NHF59676.1 M20 family metallopeptidase [Pelagihabitans pacificus]
MDNASKIQQYLDSRRSDMVIFLRKLVAMETPSREIAAQHTILSFLQESLEKLEYYSLMVRGEQTGGYLYARPKNRIKKQPLQLLIGHCDTVWPIDTLAEMPVVETMDKIKGPGVYDMKSGLTQLLFALQTIKELDLPLTVTPMVLINSDEEIGSRESTKIIKTLAQLADRAFVLEPPLGLDGKLKTARKGLGRFTITARGKAAHAGLDPGKGINAIVELSYQIQKLYDMNDAEKGITVNVGMIEGGISPNVVAPESKAVIDVRVLTESDGAEITDKIKGLKPHLPDIELRIEGGIGRPPMERTARNQKLWETTVAQGDRLGIALQQATAGGGSDANTTSLFTATIDGLGTPGDGAHAPHEYVLRNKLVERTALLTLLLLTERLNEKS